MNRWTRDDQIADLLLVNDMAGNGRPFDPHPRSWLASSGGVHVHWDTLHGLGHTTRTLTIKHQDIPELVKLLMEAYVQHEKDEALTGLKKIS